jgi:predicted nuclease of predicted toxin-antitoxin system
MAKVSFYFDEMGSRKAAEQLIRRGYSVILANDVGMTEKGDPEHLAYAAELGHVVVTFDREFAGTTSKSTEHAGLVCLSVSQDDVGGMVRLLSAFADDHTPEDVAGQVFWLK